MAFRPEQIPQLVAHMGDTTTHPPNTLAAFRDAITSDVEMVEIDVTVTADGVAVCTHGPRLEPWTDGRGKVHRNPWKRVRELRVRVRRDAELSPHRVPSLREVLSCVGGRVPINLDIKRFRALEPAVAALGRDQDFGVISGLTPRQARHCLRRYPGLPILVNLNGFDKVVASLGFFRAGWLTRPAMRRLYRRREVIALNLNHAWVDDALVTAVHCHGAQVWVFTAANQAEVDAAVAAGVDSVTVDLWARAPGLSWGDAPDTAEPPPV